MKLNQVIAIVKGAKQNTSKEKTEVYQVVQKTALFQGLNRTYQPRDEEGFVYPAETQKVTMKADDLIQRFSEACTELFDIAATQDWANTEAKADIKVDEKVILKDVPVTYLMFLEKQLIDIRTFVKSLPALAIDKDWEYDSNRAYYVTEPKETTKTKKITDFVVAYEATENHPAQIKEVSKDIVEGTWVLVELSGALPQDRINELVKRVDKLIKAIIAAREEANDMEVDRQKVSEAIFNYLFS